MSADAAVPLAFLGPVGTYSHQAAYELCGSRADYRPQRTIGETFAALVKDEVPMALLPWENSIHGVVQETLNLMRLPEVGRRVRVLGQVVLGVQHCLLVRKGVKVSEVKRVLSHEQALGQCQRYLAAELPDAEVVPVASTAYAAERVAAGVGEDADSAAICSSICADLYPGLEIMQRGIQDSNDNFTRFMLLSTLRSVCHLISTPHLNEGLLRISLPAQGTATFSDVLRTLSDSDSLAVTRMDRKPALSNTPFHDVYFVVLRWNKSLTGKGAVENGEFVGELQSVVSAVGSAVQGTGGEATVLGWW